MIPIIVCTVGSPSLKVLKASAETYAPNNQLIIRQYPKSTFGVSYNQALSEAFEAYDEVFVSNDDIVLTPHTIPTLLKDVEKIRQTEDRIGFVGTMADNVRPSQNVRYKFFDNDQIIYGKYQSEHVIKSVPVVAPIFCWLSKAAFQAAQFPPLTWYSDDIICLDMKRKGFNHFISTAYVHHVGSNTIGHDYAELRKEALEWVKKHRPEYVQELQSRLSS